MDYGSLIRRAWRLTWQNRFLWALGLFATSTVGSCAPTGSPGDGVQWRAGRDDLGQISPELERGMRAVGPWFEQNAGFFVAAAILAALLGVAFMVVSLIAQGGMARGTADLALGRAVTAGDAWGTGLRLFWRYLLLWLLLVGVTVLVAVVVGGLVVSLFVAASAIDGPSRIIFILLGGLLAVAGVLALIPAAIAVTVAVALAQRAIAVEDVGPLEGLRTGFRLLRDHLGTAALLWLINLGLSLGAGIGVVVLIVLLMIPLGAVAAVLFVSTAVSPALVVYVIAAVLALILAGWGLGAIANSFFWNYWTLAYLNFTGRLTEQLEVPPAARE